MEDKNLIGNKIRQRRESLGMTQEELAQKLGYKSRSSINKIEIAGWGLPQNKISAIAKALDTTPGYLLGWDDEERDVELAAKITNLIRNDNDMQEILEMYYELPRDKKELVVNTIKTLMNGL